MVDGLLALLNREGSYTQGYVDDLALLITRIFPTTVSELMQRALNTIQSWCRAKVLSFNPDKMEFELFTKRMMGNRFIDHVLLNRTIRPTGSVNYLGVILDTKLTWRETAKQRISEAYSSLWLGRRTLDKTWDLIQACAYVSGKCVVAKIWSGYRKG